MDSATPTQVIFIGGRSGAGKTTVASAASRILAGRIVRHAVIEGDNLDQAHPEPWRVGIDLAEQNLTAIWQNYRRAGYHRLLFTNTVSVAQVDVLSRALGGTVEARAVLLTADDDTVAARLGIREFGAAVEDHIDRSRRAAAELAALDVDVRIATDGRTPDDVAHELLRATGWLAS